MIRRGIYLLCVFGAALLVLTFLSGCGGSGSTSTPATGVEARGILQTTRDHIEPGDLTGWGNQNYTKCVQIPTAYSVAISKFELLKGVDDADPYVIFDTGSDFSNARIIEMSGSDPVSMGSNVSYPTNGTYTHVRYTLAYLELTVEADTGAGLEPTKVRVYASTVGNIQDGDATIFANGHWCWVSNGEFVPVTEERPNDVMQSDGFARPDGTPGSDDYSPDPWSGVSALAEPLVIDNPTGKYVLSVVFDVTQTPEHPGVNGTFMWDDVTADEHFVLKPYTDGGDLGDPGTGPGSWAPKPPVITVTAAKQ